MFGLPGPTLRDEDVSLFKETRAAGLIVYRRNFDSPAGLLRLLGSLEGALGRRLLVATDHEGGRVVMLGGATTIFPDNLAVGTAGEEAFAHRQGLVEATELRRLGVDLNLAPVLDVLPERYRPIVEDCLRNQLGFRGVIVTDDLEMGAIVQSCPVGEAAVRAAQAGHDLLLVCHTEPAQRAAAAALLDAYRANRLPRRGLEAAVERVRRLREQRSVRFEGGPPARELDGPPLAMAIATRAVTPVTAGAPGFRRALNGSVTVVFPRFSELGPRITIEPEVANERAYLEGAFASVGIAPAVLLVGIEPTGDEIRAAAERAAVADATVLFLYDAHLFASNRALLEALEARARALSVVLLRDPYDAALLAPGILGITAYGFRKCQLDAVIARLAYP